MSPSPSPSHFCIIKNNLGKTTVYVPNHIGQGRQKYQYDWSIIIYYPPLQSHLGPLLWKVDDPLSQLCTMSHPRYVFQRKNMRLRVFCGFIHSMWTSPIDHSLHRFLDQMWQTHHYHMCYNFDQCVVHENDILKTKLHQTYNPLGKKQRWNH